MKIILGIICAAALAVGLYLGGWWLIQSNTNRRAHVNRTTYEYQQTLRTTLERKLSDVKAIDVEALTNKAPELKAQRVAIVAEMCSMADQLVNDIPPRIVTFQQEEC